MRRSGATVILVSFCIGYLLAIFPLPEWMLGLRPHWMAMFVIFWVVAAPERIGVWVAWWAGLFLDALHGVYFGIHAISLATVAYVAFAVHSQMRLRSGVEQAVIVFVMLLAYQIEVFTIYNLVGLKVSFSFESWLPVPVSAILWLWFAPFMQAIKLRYHVR